MTTLAARLCTSRAPAGHRRLYRPVTRGQGFPCCCHRFVGVRTQDRQLVGKDVFESFGRFAMLAHPFVYTGEFVAPVQRVGMLRAGQPPHAFDHFLHLNR